jgi:succinate dehydrogenase/fumarate reductase flavoprotein subunit
LRDCADRPSRERHPRRCSRRAHSRNRPTLYVNRAAALRLSLADPFARPIRHYQNGGLEFAPDGTTKVPRLFLAGEVAGGIHGENRLMGNSLLDIVVYGKISGKSATEYVKSSFKDGKLTLDHVRAFEEELKASGAGDGRVAPMLVPDYTDPAVRERQLTATYQGTVR